MTTHDVLVIGGGFTGMALAAAFANGRRNILVLEARNGPDPRFRGELIHPPGVRELDTLGFLSEMRKAGGEEVRGFAVVPAADRDAVELPYEPPPNGPGMGYAMDHQHMVDVMRSVVAKLPRVEIRTGERATDVIREHGRIVGVKTQNGEFRANLTLIAEGRLSKLRGMLGLDGEMTLLSYSVALLAKGARLPHPGHGHVVIGAPGPVLAYPIGHAVRFCIDVPTDTERGRDAIARRLRAEYAPVLPPLLRTALFDGLDHGHLELCATQQLRTSQCVLPGVALVGDAGGCSHPITATGMTTSLHDVRTLVTQIDKFGEKEGLDLALETYERERYRYVRQGEILTERLYDVFLGREDGFRTLRDGMLEYWQETARARNASMALLAGHDTSIASFAREFTTVFGYATRAALRPNGPEGRRRSLSDRLKIVREMTAATTDTLKRATSTAVREVMR
jgi:2-polyprenyl-6-methoxyphenol hydroxylase-like FAD-dependent oxidoreductase